jgi:hypothetical protein
MFEKLKMIVLSVLGLTELPVEGKKLNFTEEQKSTLATEFSEFGSDFVEKFAAMHDKVMLDQSVAENAQAAESAYHAAISTIEAKTAEEIQSLKAQIDALSRKPVEDIQSGADARNSGIGAQSGKYPVNLKALHNTIAGAYLMGDSGPFLAAADTTIDVDDLKTEFGTTTTKDREFIRRKLTYPTDSMQYMTTVLAEDSWRATEATFTSVVQQFIAKWTPLGKGKFTPTEILNRRHKINVEFIPSDIVGSWISYLYDEGLKPQDMPITKYMVESVIAKAEEDREMLLIGKGRYVALVPGDVTEGDAGQATGGSMDGFLTVLEKAYENPDTKVSFQKLGIITAANIVEKFNQFVDNIDPLFTGKKLPIFASRQRAKLYKREYQDLYPSSKNEDKDNYFIDFSDNRLVALNSMSGSGHFFCTPKENFIRLKHKNNGTSKVFTEKVSIYKVGLVAEFREAVGYAFEEPVFAYIDPIELINRYAETSDASKLQLYMLTDAGITDVDDTALAAYKVAIAAADDVADQAALQAIVDAVNAA